MTYDIAVIGGGIIGLATTRELLLRHPRLRVVNLEKEDAHARHQTGRNSGVVHSGIYYRPGTLKARLCVEGRELIERYCEERGLPYRRVGKLIVAVDEHELGRLYDLWDRGRVNGVPGLALLDTAEIRLHEPHVRGIRALHSPQTAITDFALIAQSFAHDASEAGADLRLGAEVVGMRRRADAMELETAGGSVIARCVIACAGLQSDRVAEMTGAPRDPRIVPFRGDYLILTHKRRSLVRGNIYPVPDPQLMFLGVHFTPRIDGSVWLGPNAVAALAREGYARTAFDVRDAADALGYDGFWRLAARHWVTGIGELYRDFVTPAYVRALQRYIPELEIADCLPGPSGIRAQAVTEDGAMVDDFVIDDDIRVMHVRNAPSPGATSSLAIARYLVEEAGRRLDLEGAGLSAAPGKPSPVTTSNAFIEIDELQTLLGNPKLRIVDARSTPHGAPGVQALSAAEQYALGHIPGAIQLDYADQLADPATPHAARVAPPELFARMLGERGIGDDSIVVAYDEGETPYAARFVWMCRYYGHDDVRVLAGGLPAWVAAAGALSTETPSYAPATFTSHVRPALRASREEVLAVAQGRSDTQLLETQRDKTYAMRDQDIAGARRLSGSLLLEDHRGGRIAELAKIDRLIDDLGLDRHKRTIVSCGSGVSASGAYLALLADGFTDVAVYDGSWMEWSHHNDPTVPKPTE